MKMYNTADPSLENLWKMCGRDTEAGRIMYRFYGSHCKPEVKYPPVKTKSAKQIEEEKMAKEEKKKICPQRAKVEYPEAKPTESRRIAPIKFVPKKKTKQAIEKEMQESKRLPPMKPQPGQNRAEMIDQLQEKYQFSAGILPKGVQTTSIEFDKKPKQMTKSGATAKGRFTQPPPKPVTTGKKTEMEELDDLFDNIMKEIEERQEHLETVLKAGKNPEIEARIKTEITSRISELQKVAELKKEVAAQSK